jgi:uncharacterized protein YkwD
MKPKSPPRLRLMTTPVLAVVFASLLLGGSLAADEANQGSSLVGRGEPLPLAQSRPRVGAPPAVSLQTSPMEGDTLAWEISAPLSTTLFLPIVVGEEPPSGCAPNLQEAQIAQFMIEHPEQQRPSLTCHPILAQVARERAQDMADRHYFSHVNPDGYGPNYLVEQAGYDLPSYYDSTPDANNIESIAGGYATAEAAWQGWMNSPGHRTHLLGLDPFWAEQIDYGIGYVYEADSDYGHYWVVITAKPGP